MNMLDRKTDDPDDIRRVEGIHNSYQNQVRRHGATPSVNVLEDLEICAIDIDGTLQLGLRSKGELYTVNLTKV